MAVFRCFFGLNKFSRPFFAYSMSYRFGKLWHLAIIWAISASYKASHFCWQIRLDFLEHLIVIHRLSQYRNETANRNSNFYFVNSSQMLGSVQKSLFLFIPIQFVPNHDTQQMLLSKWKWLVVPSKPISSKLPAKLPTLTQWQILQVQAMVQVGLIVFSNLPSLSGLVLFFVLSSLVFQV